MKVEHVVKIENGIVERAVQQLTAPPGSPVDTQMWFDKNSGQMAVFANGKINPLNVRVLGADPIVPQDPEIWINATTNELKYHVGGSTFTISMTAGASSSQSLGDYYAVLSEDELGQLADAGLLYPNYLIDAFNSQSTQATFTNTAPQASALRLAPAQLTGNAKYEMESSTYTQKVEGIAVITPQGFKPLSYVDNGDGTATVVVAGDATGYFANLVKLLVFKEIQVNGATQSVYVIGSDNNLAIFNIIGAAVFASGNTTLTLNVAPGGPTIDILAQLAVSATALRFYRLPLTLKAGGAGAGGSQDTIVPTDAHGLDTLRTLGGDVERIITADIKENIGKVVVNKSPSGQFCIIGAVRGQPAPLTDVAELNIYYSVDGLNTLQKMTQTHQMVTAFTGDQFDNAPQYYMFEDYHIQINDSGKFVLAFPVTGPVSGDVRPKVAYGDLLAPSPNLIFAQGMSADGPGIQAYNNANHVVCTGLRLDPNDRYLVVVTSQIPQGAGYRNEFWYDHQGANFLGCSDNYAFENFSGPCSLRWYMNLEGEQQIASVSFATNNDFPQFMKKKLSEVLAGVAATPFPADLSVFRMKGMFANETVLQPIADEGSCFHISTSLDDDRIRSMWWSDSNERSFYTEAHLEDVFVGTDEVQHLAFSGIPASGQWSLTFGANTTSALGFSATASQVQTALQALASIGAGNVLVTGNYASGFDLHYTGTLKKAPQALIIIASDTLQDVSSNPVTITPTETTLGVLPVYPHLLNQNRADFAGVGDKVVIKGNREDYDYGFNSGGFTSRDTGYEAYSKRRFKSHPTNSNRAFMVWNTWNNIDTAPSSFDGEVLQFDHLDSFQGMFFNRNNGVPAVQFIGALADSNHGTEAAGLVTPDRNITLRALKVQATLTWNDYPALKPRSGQYLRCKLVNVSGGLPNEASTISTSPTRLNIQDYFTGTLNWLPFRFDNVALTNGVPLYVVLYLEGVDVLADWPTGAGEPGGGVEIGWYGNSAANGALKYGGIWNLNNVNPNVRMYDYFVEPIKTPEMALFPKYDLSQPGANYAAIRELQLEFNPGKTELMASYNISGNVQGDTALYAVWRDNAYRRFSIPAADTFLPDLNSPSPTLFLGYDSSTFDPNLMFHVRLSDPTYPKLDKYGKQHFATSGHNDPIRGIDVANGSNMNWASGLQFQLGNVNYGHQIDNRFKSGWATKFGGNGYSTYWLGGLACTRTDNFIYEMELCPTPLDIAGGPVVLSTGGANGIYIQITTAGAIIFGVRNNNGPAIVAGNTLTTPTLNANEYCRIRITRSTDQLIRVYRWRTNIEGWLELTYVNQGNMAFKCFTPTANGLTLGGDYNNTSLYNGLIGEVKIAFGTSFKNGDGIADQRPILETHNLGDRIIGKKVICKTPSQVNADGNADASNNILSHLSFLSPGATTGKVAVHDQLLKYSDETMPQGKKLAATLQLDRVSTADSPAVQGFLLNYSKN